MKGILFMSILLLASREVVQATATQEHQDWPVIEAFREYQLQTL